MDLFSGIDGFIRFMGNSLRALMFLYKIQY